MYHGGNKWRAVDFSAVTGSIPTHRNIIIIIMTPVRVLGLRSKDEHYGN
jgi:hypothetical protein